jgi:hypothetical protein
LTQSIKDHEGKKDGTVTWQSWVWLGMAAMFLVVEGIALHQKDRPGHPRTLSANVWWLVRGSGSVHVALRSLLAVGLAALTAHLLG